MYHHFTYEESELKYLHNLNPRQAENSQGRVSHTGLSSYQTTLGQVPVAQVVAMPPLQPRSRE